MNYVKTYALMAIIMASLIIGTIKAEEPFSLALEKDSATTDTRAVYFSANNINNIGKKKIIHNSVSSNLLNKKQTIPDSTPRSDKERLEQELDLALSNLISTTLAMQEPITEEINVSFSSQPQEKAIELIEQATPNTQIPIVIEPITIQPPITDNATTDTSPTAVSLGNVTEKIAKYDEGITAMKKIRKSLVRLLILQLNQNSTLNFSQEQQDIQRDLVEGTRSFYDFFSDFQKNPTPWLPRYLQEKSFLPLEFILDKEKFTNLEMPTLLDTQSTSSQDIIDTAIKIVQTEKAQKKENQRTSTSSTQEQIDQLIQHALNNAIQEVTIPQPTTDQPIEQIASPEPAPASVPATQIKPATGQLGADISFLILDAKYTKNKIKILEFGEGPRSRFAGYSKIFGEGKIWEMFWHYLAQFNQQIWYVGPALEEQSARDEIAIRKFNAVGGINVTSIKELVQHPKFPAIAPVIDERAISSYKGIVVFRHKNPADELVSAFRKQYPHLLVLDSGTGRHVNNKYLTSTLFDTKQLTAYRPQCKAYPKKYHPDLAKNIINDFNCSTLVIKPLNAFKGSGIIITHASNLDDHLRNILPMEKRSKKIRSTTSVSDAEKYWLKDKNQNFIVEEYEASQPIEVESNLYDPTMRMVFTLHYDEGKIHLTFLDGYWKLPTQPLIGAGTLNDKHISKIGDSGISSAAIAPADLVIAKTALQKALPRIYFKMMKSKNIPAVKSLPLTPITFLKKSPPLH
ncbi:hypothetical protein IPF37_00400 [bacterium]|nr:MAG: hypothetical protein IPF37_00400 [bacterium]